MDDNLEMFECALSFEYKHYIETPITLICGHSACHKCLQLIKDNTGLEHHAYCKICKKPNNKNYEYNETVLLNNLIDLNLDKFLKSVRNQIDNYKNELKNKIIQMDNLIQVQVEYVKNEIEIRAESLKLNIDEIKNDLFRQVDNIKIEYERNAEIVSDHDDDYLSSLNEANEVNKEFLSEMQYHLKELKHKISYLNSLNPKIEFKVSEDILENIMIGELDYNFESLRNHLTRKPKCIELDDEPSDICSLSNGNYLIANERAMNLKLYDCNFKLIKTINKTDTYTLNPTYMTTDNKNSIYISIRADDKIIHLDYDFNLKHVYKTFVLNPIKLKLDDPLGITYHDNCVYVCDSNNRRIQRLSHTLEFKELYSLNFKPWTIQINSNVACIRPDNRSYLSFYNLKPFYFITRVCESNGDILKYNCWFYEWYYPNQKLVCYDTNGKIIEKFDIDLKSIKEFDPKETQIIRYLNGQLVIGLTKKKLLILF